MRTKSVGRTMIAGLALVTVLAACGSGPATTGDGVASLDEGAVTTEAGEDPQAPSDPDEAFALFQECMQENGVDLPEPDEGGGQLEVQRQQGASGEASVAINGVEVDPEVFEAAEEACRPHLANIDRALDLTPEQEAAMEDANLAFQDCMAEHGIEGEFGVAAGAGPGLSVSGVDEEPDPQAVPPAGEGEMIDEEALEAATEECMKVFDVPGLEGVFGAPGE